VRIISLIRSGFAGSKPGAQGNLQTPLNYLTQVLNLPKKNLNSAWSVIKKDAPCQTQQIKGAITNLQGSDYW
jgi:hypothetical protein